jgi:hypothetical protein
MFNLVFLLHQNKVFLAFEEEEMAESLQNKHSYASSC